MMEMSCRWWPIWYLLFFCHGAEGQLQWIVKEKVTDYGQNLTLFCPVGNCCSEPPGWFVGPKTIIIDVRTFSNDPKVKYHGTFDTDGFGVVIRSLSEADLNVTYSCIYGFNQSTPKYLFHDDGFKENVPDKDKDKDEENNTVTILLIAVPIVAIILVGIMVYVYRSRTDVEKEALTDSKNQEGIKMKRQNETGTDVEKEALTDSKNQEGIKMKRQNETGTDVEKEALTDSKNQEGIKMKRQKETGTDVEKVHLNDSKNEQDLNEKIDQTNIREKERTEPEIPKTLSEMMKTFTAQSSTTEVVLCHREVKSGMIKADEQKKMFEEFIKENKFYYDDRFLKKYRYN